jgi:galacturan 1,4-alpha-galacturonidase
MVIKFLPCTLLHTILLAGLVTNAVAKPTFPSILISSGTCTLKSSGGDDGPAFAAAILSRQCPTVRISAGTTLTIASPLNTTAVYNKHISLAGTLSFTDDTVGLAFDNV